MKLPPANLTIPPRGAALRGIAYTAKYNGKLIWRRWPRRQPTPRSEKEAASREIFGLRATATNYMSAAQQEFARALADETILAPRDLLMVAQYQRLGVVVTQTGKKVYSVPAQQDVSDLIDSIAQVPGDTMFRGESLWTRLPIGTEGQVLTVAPGNTLQWQNASGGSGAPWWKQTPPLSPAIASNTAGGGALNSRVIQPDNDDTLHGVYLPMSDPGSGHSVSAAIYAANPSGLALTGGTLIAQGQSQPLAAGINQIPFDAPINLTAGATYYAGFLLEGGGNVRLWRCDISYTSHYFFLSGGTLPTTAPSASNGQGNQVGWWFY